MGEARGSTVDLWRSIDSIYANILDHPFLAGLTDGTLPEKRFRHYVLQEHVISLQIESVTFFGCEDFQGLLDCRSA